MGDALVGVVEDDGEVVAGAEVVAGDDDVAEGVWAGVDGAEAAVVEGFLRENFTSLGGVETPAGLASAAEFGGDFSRGEVAAGAGVNEFFSGVRGAAAGSEFLGNFAARAKARVHGAEILEGVKGLGVSGKARGLAEGGRGPVEAEPVEIFLDGGKVRFSNARGVDVLEAEKAFAAELARPLPSDVGGVGVPEVEPAGGAWGKARFLHARNDSERPRARQ